MNNIAKELHNALLRHSGPFSTNDLPEDKKELWLPPSETGYNVIGDGSLVRADRHSSSRSCVFRKTFPFVIEQCGDLLTISKPRKSTDGSTCWILRTQSPLSSLVQVIGVLPLCQLIEQYSSEFPHIRYTPALGGHGESLESVQVAEQNYVQCVRELESARRDLHSCPPTQRRKMASHVNNLTTRWKRYQTILNHAQENWWQSITVHN